MFTPGTTETILFGFASFRFVSPQVTAYDDMLEWWLVVGCSTTFS
jgi:hypothetical protein